jgi:hypothetical protein
MKKAPDRTLTLTIVAVVALALLTMILFPDLTRAQIRNVKMWLYTGLASGAVIVGMAYWLDRRR